MTAISNASRTLVALAAAAIALVIVAWFDDTVMGDARPGEQDHRRPGLPFPWRPGADEALCPLASTAASATLLVMRGRL